MASIDSRYKLSTFSGVFIPAVLAIFGAVVFYVAPRVLGGVGLLGMLLIIFIAHSITIATSFSISAIATNIRVKEGGLYYLISRSLGSEFGGSMGVQLFLAQAVGISFYVIAFAMAITSLFQMFSFTFSILYVSLIAFTIFWLIAFIGAQFVIRLQYIIFIVIILSFVSILFFPNRIPSPEEFIGIGGVPLSFWVAFAMFFPAVTGVDAGVGMSGDLKNPRRSLVFGSFSAVIFTMIVYVILVVKYFYSASLSDLSLNPFIVQQISVLPELVIIGVLLSTSSSALSYFMTAPRTLRALADDNIFSSRFKFLGKTLFSGNEPRIAMFIVFVIGASVLFIGDLFIVSQIVAIFFLNVYGWVNGAFFLEKLSKNPSFRPTFHAHLLIPFYGMVACYLVMFLFNPYIMLASIVFQISLFIILLRSKSSSKVESVWQGVLFQVFRLSLKWIERAGKSQKNWRPTIVAFCINDMNRTNLAIMLNWINANSGFTKLYYLISRSLKTFEDERGKIETEFKDYVTKQELQVYPKVMLSSNYTETVKSVLQSETLGNLPLNTVMIDFDTRLNLPDLVNTSRILKKNVIIMRNQAGFSSYSSIDIWWKDANYGNMMLLFAYLITQSRRWKESDSSIRIFAITRTKSNIGSLRDSIQRIVDASRVDNVAVEVIFMPKKPVKEIMYMYSRHTDLVLIGLPHTGRSGTSTQTLVKEIKKHTDRFKASLIMYPTEKIDIRLH